jgi:hypothetical protein
LSVGSKIKLYYPEGTVVQYQEKGEPSFKILPVKISDIHGNSVSITYIDRSAETCSDALRVEACGTCGVNCFKPPRQAIKQITDTLGRFVTFWYYADGNLAEIRVAKYGSGERVVAKFSYQALTLNPSFGTMIVTPSPGTQVDVLKKVYFPDTGRGYLFDDYSPYGMCRRISMRLGMTHSGPVGFTDGTEVAYTKYSFLESGTLSDSPDFNERREWWLGKTDDNGNPSPADSSGEAVFTYTRTSNTSTMTNTVAGPSGITSVLVSNNNTASAQYGLLQEQRVEVGSSVKSKQEFTYSNPSSTGSGLQRTQVTATDDGTPTANQARVISVYGDYGRLLTLREYGFSVGGSFSLKRRTVYSYLDGAYITAGLLQIVSDITVNDATGASVSR